MENKVKKLRQYLGLSMNAFGRKIGYSGKQISRYEKDEVVIPDKVNEKIINAFEVEPGYFKGEVALAKAVKLPNYEKEKDDIAKRVVKRRQELGLKQRELAKLCQCSETQISQIEHHKVNLTNEMATVLAKVLEVGVDWLLLGDENKKNYPLNEELQIWLWQNETIRKQLYEQMKQAKK